MLEGYDMDEWKDTNPKGIAATDRVSLSLMPDTAAIYGNMAFLEGALKYGRYNWRCSGVLASTYVDACRRHLMKWWAGEEIDPETNVPHLANALACISILIDAYEHNVLTDDRPPTEAREAQMLKQYQALTRTLRTKFKDYNPKQFTANDPLYKNTASRADAVDRGAPNRGGRGEHSEAASE